MLPRMRRQRPKFAKLRCGLYISSRVQGGGVVAICFPKELQG